MTLHDICPEESSEGQKNRGYKGSFEVVNEFAFFGSTKKIILQNILMNWQTEGVNSNYRSVKFEDISPKKTGDISRENVAFFTSHNIRHRIGICQDRHLSMREIPNHVHARTSA